MDLSAVELSTFAEQKAREAESLPAFSPIKLLHIKRSVAELLKQFGSNGIFDEYTRHDITHINAMLTMVEWLVPDSCKAQMQPADWLLIVLAIYFHDLGLLVTKNEFANRESSGFRAFCTDVLFTGDDGIDYRDKVERLPSDEAERFLYQEFVRSKHPERIKQWISGTANEVLGVAPETFGEINNLLRDIDPVFRRDLALICESHHLDDLSNVRKYKTRQPFGPAVGETGNLQYCAVLLRTADLLHITRDRTPSITFRTLNPSDPVSQEAWAKQMAVRAVRPQLGHDKDGNVSPAAIQDTVEIHAFFESPAGFFRLTSYLLYAEQQLRQSHAWIEAARQAEGITLSFPWKRIDDSFIETKGFINEPFEFSLDQAKILDLLTGHTLYNETSVVVRELVQNSLDAVRLQCLMEEKSPSEHGRITLHWDTGARTLTVEDNGTGMSQAIIEKHLLKVGASRYQDPDFRKDHPDFFPISRFGIGVLSCFMVADSVEITTISPDDDQARQLTLKSVHGRYLIRLLDKVSDPAVKNLGEHGTRIRLELRASATFKDPLAIATKWIVVPGCNVTLQLDDATPVPVGYSSPAETLRHTLEDHGLTVDVSDAFPRDGTIRIKQFSAPGGGLELAVAVQWTDVFQEWEFLCRPNRPIEERDEEEGVLVGTCIEGIRVQFGSPGFDDVRIYAIANATGHLAPQTNVARSSLEETTEQQSLLSRLYALYLQHIEQEIAALSEERHFSITWAVQEASFLASPLQPGRLTSNKLFMEALSSVPLLLVEKGETRIAINWKDLSANPHFWTVEGRFYDSAETLLREVAGSVSLRALVSSLGVSSLDLPDGLVLCRDPLGGQLQGSAFSNREPVKIRIDRAQRRLDVQWGHSAKPPNWILVLPVSLRRERMFRELARVSSVFTGSMRIFNARVARSAIEMEGVHDEMAVKASGTLWILPGTLFAKVLFEVGEVLTQTRQPRQIRALLELLAIIDRVAISRQKMDLRTVSRVYEDYAQELSPILPKDELIGLVEKSVPKVFDPHAWSREDGDDDELSF